MFLCLCLCVFFFFTQKTAYEMRISDWSSDVCSSDLFGAPEGGRLLGPGIGINGERPTPSGGRACEARSATARTRRRHDRRRDSADCGAGIPARSPRDHIVQISSENPGTASRLWAACAPPEAK